MKFNVPGATIHYEFSTGSNTLNDTMPALFILPGGPGFDCENYKKYTELLGDRYQIVYHDPRGCGQSTLDDITTCTIETSIRDLEALRQHLKLPKINVLGKSYGSMVATGYATQYSQYIDRLVLVTGAPSHHFFPEACSILEERGTPRQKEVCDWVFRGDVRTDERAREFLRATRSLYAVTVQYDEQAILKPAIHFSPKICDFGFPRLVAEDGFDFIEDLKLIQNETLVVSGQHDWINPPSQQKIMVDNIPKARLLTLDAGHALEVDRPEEYRAALRDFLLG